jgi:PTS system galactitol-specific IIA component
MDFAAFLSADCVLLDLQVQSSEEVIRTLGNRLLAKDKVREDFIDATLAREASMPTGLPLEGTTNAAIPHVDVEYVKESSLALATLRQPVTFQHMVNTDEAVPVRLVIMLALSEPKSQVDMLQSLAGVLQQPDVVEQIMVAKTADEVLSALNEVEIT